MQLVFEDLFEGAPGSPPDQKKWVHQTGGGGWGHNELQTYVNSRANSYLDGQGCLVLAARKDANGKWTSARLTTRGLMNWKFGRFEASIKLPKGKGLWPAFWLVGDAPSMPWPTDGEIDWLETVDGVPTEQHCTVHTVDAKTGKSHKQVARTVKTGLDLSKDFNVYGGLWTPDKVEFYLNTALVASVTKADVEKAGGRWAGALDRPEAMLLNLAVGGNWAGAPDASTPSNNLMMVDWVRVWQ